ncbi:MAG: hypothetical protein ACK53Y_10285, partial [bacterium]
LGGNGSSEIRVWAMGLIRRGKYPRIGEIVEEFSDRAKISPGTYVGGLPSMENRAGHFCRCLCCVPSAIAF